MSARPSHILVLAPALLASFALLWMSRSFVTDDAAITLRYAQNLADGAGVRWNVGEDPVEGYSNFTHVLLGALALKLGLPALTLLRFLNQLAAFLLPCLVYVLGLRMLGERLWAGAAALFVGAHGAMMYWASSGLETGLYVAGVYATLLSFLRVRTFSLWPAVWCLFVALTRFEGVVVFFIITGLLGLQAFRSRDVAVLKPHLGWIAAFVLGYGVYFQWRYAYFGYLMSNSAYFKQSDTAPEVLYRFVRDCWPLLVFALAAPYKKLSREGWLLAALVIAYAIGFARVARMIAYMHRFFLPVVPGLTLLAMSALQQAFRLRLRSSPIPMRVLSVSLVVFVFVFDACGPWSGLFDVYEAIHKYRDRMESRARMAEFIGSHFPASYALAVSDVGIVSYVLPNHIIDILGLNDERFTHKYQRKRKQYAKAVLRDSPQLFMFVSESFEAFVPRYDSEKPILENPKFQSSYVWVHKLRSDAPDYNLWLFTRSNVPDLAALRAEKTPEISDELSRSVLVDDLAARIRATHHEIKRLKRLKH